MNQAASADSFTQLEAHELTLEQFTAQVRVTKLVDHGRRWSVALPKRYVSFSDAPTAEGAIANAHRGAVNHALYLNTPDAPDLGCKPSIPPAAVLAQYPDIVARFPELDLSASNR